MSQSDDSLSSFIEETKKATQKMEDLLSRFEKWEKETREFLEQTPSWEE